MTFNNSRNEETIDSEYEERIHSEDTFSETSETSEFNKFQKDNFIVFETVKDEIIHSQDSFSDASLTSELTSMKKIPSLFLKVKKKRNVKVTVLNLKQRNLKQSRKVTYKEKKRSKKNAAEDVWNPLKIIY